MSFSQEARTRPAPRSRPLPPSFFIGSLSLLFSAVAMPATTPAPAPARQSHQELMTVDLARAATELPAPADADKRREMFAHRNDPAQIEALAKTLFSLLNPGERRMAYKPITGRLEPLKAAALQRFQKKDYPGALDAFRVYFLAKMRLLFRDGLSSSEYENRQRGELARRNYEDTVKLLMDNVYQVGTTKQTVRIGEPGLVRWDFDPAGPKLWENVRSCSFEYFSSGAAPFDRLWWKFTDTGEQKYLQKYLDFLDDYVMNQSLQADLNAGNLDLGKNGTADALSYLRNLAEIARWLPDDGRGYSSASLARMLVRIVGLQLPQSLYYNREQSNNHSCGAIGDQLNLANCLLDFSFAKVLEKESQRQFEAYGTLFDLPDGDMPTRMRYDYSELQWNLASLGLLREYEFDWFTRQLRLEYTDRLVRRAAAVLNLYNANGECVQLYKADRRNGPFDSLANQLTRELPETWNEPAAAAIAARIMHNQCFPDWQGKVYLSPQSPAAREGEGLASGAEPPYNSVSLPYIGTHILRSGWDAARDSYGIFVESDGGGSVHGTKCANTLLIGAFGQDVLHTGLPYQYNYVPSPVLVDGCDQFRPPDRRSLRPQRWREPRIDPAAPAPHPPQRPLRCRRRHP